MNSRNSLVLFSGLVQIAINRNIRQWKFSVVRHKLATPPRILSFSNLLKVSIFTEVCHRGGFLNVQSFTGENL